MGSSFVEKRRFVEFPPESVVSVFSYGCFHNGVLGTLFCQSIDQSRYSRNWVDMDYYFTRYNMDSLPDLKVAAAFPDIIFPYSRAPIWQQMRGYLLKNGGDYTETQIIRNEDDGRLDVYYHVRDPWEIEYANYSSQTWEWYQIRDISAASLWYMSKCMHPVGPIDFWDQEHVHATPIIAAVASPIFFAGAPKADERLSTSRENRDCLSLNSPSLIGYRS